MVNPGFPGIPGISGGITWPGAPASVPREPDVEDCRGRCTGQIFIHYAAPAWILWTFLGPGVYIKTVCPALILTHYGSPETRGSGGPAPEPEPPEVDFDKTVTVTVADIGLEKA